MLATIVSGGTVVAPDGPLTADIAIADGRIAEVAPALDSPAAEIVDARVLTIMPGVVDAHVHLNQPGRADWEGWTTGTRALAAGGATTALDMPVNSLPPVTTAAAFDAKRTAARRSSVIDFGLWGGLSPQSLPHLEELHACGVVGFKAFMCNTGLDEFLVADDLTLYEGMTHAARLRALVAVHAENDKITSGLASRAQAAGWRSARDFLASRPMVCELEAISPAIAIADETRCALHIVHVSCGKGVALIAEARARGVDVRYRRVPSRARPSRCAYAALRRSVEHAPRLIDNIGERTCRLKVTTRLTVHDRILAHRGPSSQRARDREAAGIGFAESARRIGGR